MKIVILKIYHIVYQRKKSNMSERLLNKSGYNSLSLYINWLTQCVRIILSKEY